MDHYKFIKLGVFTNKIIDNEDDIDAGEDIFIGDTNLYEFTGLLDRSELSDNQYMNIPELEVYLNTMKKDGWSLDKIQPFNSFEEEYVVYYAILKKDI